jgi:rhamnogalacturonan acetylesterase
MKSAVLLSMIPSVLGTTIYLAGDSTMAKGGTGSGTAGMILPTKLNHLLEYI